MDPDFILTSKIMCTQLELIIILSYLSDRDPHAIARAQSGLPAEVWAAPRKSAIPLLKTPLATHAAH